MSRTLEKAFPAFKGGMIPCPRGRSSFEEAPPIGREESSSRKSGTITSMKFRQVQCIRFLSLPTARFPCPLLYLFLGRPANDKLTSIWRQDHIFLSESSPRSIAVYQPDPSLTVTIRSPRRSPTHTHAISSATLVSVNADIDIKHRNVLRLQKHNAISKLFPS